jgi:hypothetical protein
MDLEGKGRFARQCSWILLLSLIPIAGSAAQQIKEPAASNIEILKLHWEKQITVPRNFDPYEIPTNGTFTDPASRTSAAAPSSPLDATRSATARSAAAAGSSNPFPATPGRLPVFYVYSLKINNTGAKLIEGIAWDYLFIDPKSNAELGKHQFLSYAIIPSQKSATLKSQLRSPPIRILRGADSEKNTRSKLTERAMVQCILFADGTVWKNPSARPGVCELLKNSKALMKRTAE